MEKTEDAYNRDMADKYGDDWATVIDGTNPATYVPNWNELTDKEKEEMAEKYAPHLSSTERNQRQRAEKAEKKAKDRQDAKDAVRNYVAEQKAKMEKEGGTWTGADTAQAKRDFEKKQGGGGKDDDKDTKKDDESEAKTEALGNNEASDPNANATMQDVNAGDRATLEAAKAYTREQIALLDCGC
jgi:hypothetical protein